MTETKPMRKAYLTIDDGPSARFRDLIDFLTDRGVPAIFFNRGDCIEQRPDCVVYGIEKGFVMANHAYSHRRFSKLDLEKGYEEIRHTETLLDACYAKADKPRGPRYFRFPYMDRGMGPWLIEPDALRPYDEAGHRYLVEKGLGHVMGAPPEPALIAKKRALQDFLRQEGFSPLPTPGVTIPWYADTEMARGLDSLCTFSTSDWALSDRHRGKHGFDTVADLCAQIDNDPWLSHTDSAHIVLAHDQGEIHDVTCALIDYFLQSGFEFLDF